MALAIFRLYWSLEEDRALYEHTGKYHNLKDKIYRIFFIR